MCRKPSFLHLYGGFESAIAGRSTDRVARPCEMAWNRMNGHLLLPICRVDLPALRLDRRGISMGLPRAAARPENYSRERMVSADWAGHLPRISGWRSIASDRWSRSAIAACDITWRAGQTKRMPKLMIGLNGL